MNFTKTPLHPKQRLSLCFLIKYLFVGVTSSELPSSSIRIIIRERKVVFGMLSCTCNRYLRQPFELTTCRLCSTRARQGRLGAVCMQYLAMDVPKTTCLSLQSFKLCHCTLKDEVIFKGHSRSHMMTPG